LLDANSLQPSLSIIGAQVGWGTNAFQSRQQITFSNAKEMLIRIKSRTGVE
jgi:hypothetical protein